MSERRKVNVNKTDLGFDAWGRNKTVIDFSLFHGVWTFGVPHEMWIEYVDGVEMPDFTNFTSVDGLLKIQGVAAQSNALMSKRHPRYQPNKGHLYSSSMLLPDYTLAVNQEFGIFHRDAGAFFRVNNGILYAVRRTKVGATVTDYAEAITVPSGVDLTKGNLYDIQMQWRGVGNIFFYINQELVHTMTLLGTLDKPSIFNPALPIGFNIDGDAIMYASCVDVTAEGGHKENRQRGSIDTGEISLSSAEIPVLLVHIPATITYNGNTTMNTRDNALRRISGFADDATIIKMYFTRDGTKFTGTTFLPNDPLNTVEYSVDGNITLVGGVTDLDRQITRRIVALGNIEMINPDPEVGDVFMTHGDYVLVTMQAKNATVGGASVEWGAEI